MKNKTNKKVLMIWTSNNGDKLGGVGYYRIINPANKLKKLGFDIDVCSGMEVKDKFATGRHAEEVIDVYSNILEKYDLLWMKSTDNKEAIAAIMSLKDQFKCKVVWDFDDDVFSVRESQPAYKDLPVGGDKRAIIAAAISYCDAITVSTPYLGRAINGLMKRVYGIEKEIHVCPNFINVDEWQRIKYRPSNSPRIGYYGSITHNDDYALIKSVIYKLLAKYPTVSFEMVGAMDSQTISTFFKDVPNEEYLKRISLSAGTAGWDGFPQMLLRKNWDIAVAPLIDDEFNRSKSNIKWMETAMKEIPCVCSDVEPYKVTVAKDTGFLCNSEQEWVDTLSMLIENGDIRKTIGENARKYVVKEFTDKPVRQWSRTLKELLRDA